MRVEEKIAVEPGIAERLATARDALFGNTSGAAVSMFSPSVLSLANGDGSAPAHPSALAAGIDELANPSGLASYLYYRDDPTLIEAICADNVDVESTVPTAAEVYVDAGASRAFCTYLSTATQRGDVLLTAPGVYHGVLGWCDAHGVDLRFVRGDDPVKLEPNALRRWITEHRGERVRGILVFNPTFTGATYSDAELADLAEVVLEHDLFVVCDTIFRHTEFAGEPVRSLRDLPGMASRAVTISGASKAHNLANLRVGWAVGSQDVIAKMRGYRNTTMGAVPRLAQRMAAAAMCAPRAYFRENARTCAARVQLIEDLTVEVNAHVESATGVVEALRFVHEPVAGHSLILEIDPSIGGTAWNASADLTRHLLQKHLVAVSPSVSMGLNGAVIRIAYGSVGLQDGSTTRSGRDILREAFLGRIAPGLCDFSVGTNTSRGRRA